MLTEIEGKRQAEEAAENWQKEWKKLSHHLSLIALSLPSLTVAEDSDDTSMYPGAELCQQITVSQLVAAATLILQGYQIGSSIMKLRTGRRLKETKKLSVLILNMIHFCLQYLHFFTRIYSLKKW
jgi:hypothetical protein